MGLCVGFSEYRTWAIGYNSVFAEEQTVAIQAFSSIMSVKFSACERTDAESRKPKGAELQF